MMGVSVADARGLSLWEYEALLTVWNERHPGEDAGDGEVELLDWGDVSAALASIPKAYLN